MNASSLLVPSPFGRAFLRAPSWLQEALRHHGFGPHQSDGHVLIHTCLRPAVPEDELVLEDHPDFVDVGTMVTWTTTFVGYILNTALTIGWGVETPQQGTTWKSIYRCWNFWPKSGEALTPLLTLRGSFDGRSWTENEGWTVSFLLRLQTSSWSSGDTGSHLVSKSWGLSIRRSWKVTWEGNGRNAYWHTWSPMLWPVITRAISTGCWMTTRERCLQLACSWKSCSNSRLRVVVWCHPMWRETTTNGQMISLTLLLKGLTLRWNLWLHHYSQSSRSSLGYYNILMHKVIFLDRSQSSLPLLLRRWRRGGSASTGFGWSYSPRTLSWERYFSLILTLFTCGLRTGDLVCLCQLLALLVRLDFWSTWQGPFWSTWQGPFWIWPRNLWAHFDTCQQARVAQTGTQTQKEKVLLLLLLGCCLSVSSVGLFS